MLELSSTLSASEGSVKRKACGWRILSTALPITQVALVRLLVLLIFPPFSQQAFARPVSRPPQTSNALEALKWIAEGQRLVEKGMRAAIVEAIEEALRIARERKSASSEALALLSRGSSHNALGDRQRAILDYNEALRVGREAGIWTAKATVLNNLAEIYLDLGEIEKSLALYEESIRVCETEGEPEGAASPLNGIGAIYVLRAEPLKALGYYQKSLALARAVKHQSQEAGTLINISRVFDLFGQHEQALKANHDAVAVYKAVEDPGGEATALTNLGAIYNKLDRHAEALEYLNRALEIQRATENRAGLAYTLQGIGTAHRDGGNPAKARATYAEALALMTAVEDRVGEATVSNNLGFTYDLQGDYQKSSEYYLRALSLTRATGDLRGEATVLGNLGFMREKQGDLKEAESLYEQAINVRENMRAAARLEEFKTEVAGEDHTIYYLPAGSLLPSVERRSGRACKRLLALAEAKASGRPSLRYVDQEAKATARLYQGKALLSGQASKDEFLRLAGDYDILHIASHAELNTRSPLFSRILLTPNQNGNQGLEVREIYDLNLKRTNLVMLSACETQLGAQSRGDEIVGLNRAFIYAGASTVIASLWRVDDRATSLLMRSFYAHLKRGMGKAEALRMAQSETRRQYANPYYWAAFVLTGEPGLSGQIHADGTRRNMVRRRK